MKPSSRWSKGQQSNWASLIGLLTPGAAYFEERHRRRVISNLERRAKMLGYELSETDPGTASLVS